MWGNPDWYDHSANANKYEPKWEKLVDYNPDHNPSASLTTTVLIGNRLARMWHVRGLGVLMADVHGDDAGTLQPHGLSIFSKDDIGWSPTL